MFEIGEKVKIKDMGQLYTTYEDFFKDFEPTLLERYALNFCPAKRFTGKIIFKHLHEWTGQGMLYVVEN